jgi:hypothetical protein
VAGRRRDIIGGIWGARLPSSGRIIPGGARDPSVRSGVNPTIYGTILRTIDGEREVRP